MADQVDVVVLGMGVGGEEVGGRLAEAGLAVVGIENTLVGGECPYWGCVPSKMMIRAANLLTEGRRIDGMAGHADVTPDWEPVASRIRDEISKVQAKLSDDEALIEYVVGPDSVMTFVITRQIMTAMVTPLRLADLNARISLLRDLAQRPGDDRWLKPATRLAAGRPKCGRHRHRCARSARALTGRRRSR